LIKYKNLAGGGSDKAFFRARHLSPGAATMGSRRHYMYMNRHLSYGINLINQKTLQSVPGSFCWNW
jgi:hypothetical protein